MSEINRCDGPPPLPNYYEEEASDPLGAQCKNASSDASKSAGQTDDDPKLRDYLRTKAIDPPLQDDVIGNMIPGAIVGGVSAGVAAAASRSSLGAMAATAGTIVVKDVVKDVVKGAAKQAVIETVKNSVDVTTLDESMPEPPPVGQDRSPYAPGHAPIRIPEAPVVIRG